MAMNDAVSHYFSDYLQWRRNEFESGGGTPVQSKSGGALIRCSA